MNLRIVSLLCTLTLAPLLGFAAPGSSEAEQKLHSAVDQVLSIVGRAPDTATLIDRITPVLEKNISFATMTRRAVGPGWKNFSAEQQQKATALFTRLAIRSYGKKFTIGEQPEVKYNSTVAPAAGRTDCNTTFVYQGNRYSVVYRMEQEVGWDITDVVIEGVSIVANYRSQLDPVYKKGGAAAVVSSLEQSVARSK